MNGQKFHNKRRGLVDTFDSDAFNEEYARNLAVMRGQFDKLYLPGFEAYSALAAHDLQDDEQQYFSALKDPIPTDGRTPSARYLMPSGISLPTNVGEDVFQFGTHVDAGLRKGIMRRHVTARLLPVQGNLEISAFTFFDGYNPSGHDERFALWFPTVPLPLDRTWNVEYFLADLWRRIVPIQKEDLIPESRGWWVDPRYLMPAELL